MIFELLLALVSSFAIEASSIVRYYAFWLEVRYECFRQDFLR